MGWFGKGRKKSKSVQIKNVQPTNATLSRSATTYKKIPKYAISYVEIDRKFKTMKIQKILAKKLKKEKGDMKLYIMKWCFDGIVEGDLTVSEPNSLFWASEKEMGNLSSYVMVYTMANEELNGFVPKDYLVEIESPRALQGYADKSRNELGDLGDCIFVFRPCSDPSPTIICAMTVNQNGTYHHFKIAKNPQTGFFEIQGRSNTFDTMTLLVESMIKAGLFPYTEPSPPVTPRVAISHIDADNITKLKKLGSGQFGEVSKAKLKLMGDKSMVVALKELVNRNKSMTDMSEKDDLFKAKRNEFLCEAAAMQYLHNEEQLTKSERAGKNYIVNLIGAVMDEQAGMCMIIEFCKQGSVEELMSTMREADIITFCIHTISAVNYLGKKGILHRDIASRNVLVDSSNKSSLSKIYKLSDYGMACLSPELADDAQAEKGKYAGIFRLNYKDIRKQRTPIRWTSPESLKLLTATSEADFQRHLRNVTTKDNVWSWAMTVIEVFGQRNPFPEIKELKAVRQRVLQYLDDEPPSYIRPKYMPESLFDVINKSCIVPHYKRISEKKMLETMSAIKIHKDKKVEYTNIADIGNLGF